MMKIGDFSRLTNVPVKTLRYYAEIGLLKPALIEDNHYRYYGLEQLLAIKRILELKDTGFTLNEIAHMNIQHMKTTDLLTLYEQKLVAARKELQFAHMKVANLERKISELQEKEKKKMILNNLTQTPDHTTFVGMIKGISDYYQLGYNEAMIYGLTGHAFMINIHDALCPSGPYCFDLTRFTTLLQNMGLKMKDLGFFMEDTPVEVRQDIEMTVKNYLDKSTPCALLNLEYQIISGYDKAGFVTAQPWTIDYPPKHLTWQTWEELNNDIHMNFFAFEKIQPQSQIHCIKAALQTAIDIHRAPNDFTSAPYFTGSEAYDHFIKAIEAGHGQGQGNRWNGLVWGECRAMASTFFEQLASLYSNHSDLCLNISHDYQLIGEGLVQLTEENLPIGPRVEVLKDIQRTEQEAIKKIEQLLSKL